jgi:hypothetical protein
VSHDAFGPAEIEHIIENIGGRRANLPRGRLLVLGVDRCRYYIWRYVFTTTVKGSSASFDFARVVN